MSSDWMKRFHYSLDPFLKKRKLDWAELKIDESQARSVVERREKEAASIQGVIGEIELQLRSAAERGASIDRDQHQNLSRYLGRSRRDLTEKQKQVVQASKVHEQISLRLREIRQGIKALEKHRIHKQSQHAQESIRLEHNQVDELWLLRNGRRQVSGKTQDVPRVISVSHKPKQRDGGDNNAS